MKIKKEIKIGIFGVLMFATLFWGINFLKGRDIFVSTRTYYATFEQADGLKPTTEVLMKGVKIGSVTDIFYNPLLSDKIIVEFSVQKGYKIPTDSRVVASNKFIVGGTVLNLVYGEATTYFKENDTIPAIGAPDVIKMATDQIDDIKAKAVVTVDNINQILESLNTLLSKQNINNISQTISSLNTMTSTDLRIITSNLGSISKNLNNNTQSLNNIMANVEEFSDSLKKAEIAQLINNSNKTMQDLNVTIEKIKNGEGTAGKMVNDPALYDSLVKATHNLTILLEDVKLHPKRYVSISVFGGGKNK